MKEGSLVSVLLLICMIVLPSSGRTLSGKERLGRSDRPGPRGGVVRGLDSTLREVPQGLEDCNTLRPRASLMKSRKTSRRMKVVSPSQRVGAAQDPSTNDHGSTNDSSTASVTTTATAAAVAAMDDASSRTTFLSSSSFNLSTFTPAESSLRANKAVLKADGLMMIHESTVDSVQVLVDSVLTNGILHTQQS